MNEVRRAVLCAWCGRTIPPDRSDGSPSTISHGICLECLAETGVMPIYDLHALSRSDYDALPFGALQMDADGRVLEYNAAEQRLSGLDRDRVLGKRFFQEVAPCTELAEFARRYLDRARAGETYRESVTFLFEFSGGARMVELAVAFDERHDKGLVLVREID